MMRGGPMGHGHMARTEEEQAQNRGRAARRLWQYLSPYKPRLALISLLMTMAALATVASPYLIGRAIDRFIEGGDPVGLARTMLALAAIYVFNYIANAGAFYLMAWLGQHTLKGLRQDIFAHLQRLSLRYFDTHEAGDLMSRLVNDTDTINQLFSGGLNRIVINVLSLVGILIAMTLLQWQLALASFTVLPFMLVATLIFARRARTAYRRTREKIGAVSADLEENISGVREVQAFSRERVNWERFQTLNAENRDANVGAQAITSAFMPAVDILSTIAIAIVAGFGGYLAIQGTVTVGVIVAFLTYVQRFFEPIRALSILYTTMQSALAGAERIFDLLDEEAETEGAPDAGEISTVQGQVTFERVHFGYKPEEEVLHDINFVAEPGQTVALVGPTGAGKTSIVNLLLRFYDPWSGVITIDTTNTQEVKRASLRRQMSIVLQDTFLFSGTLRENIRYGRLEATDEEVEAAARAVNAHEFIHRFPKGYDTPVLERGANLSQGQRQLIAFARAVLADPRILVLDEATSSVDTLTESLIQQALRTLLQGRTSIVIAHRLSTIRNADQVLVVDEGRITERGTHDELLAQGGVYHDLYMSQFEQHDVGEGEYLRSEVAAA